MVVVVVVVVTTVVLVAGAYENCPSTSSGRTFSWSCSAVGSKEFVSAFAKAGEAGVEEGVELACTRDLGLVVPQGLRRGGSISLRETERSPWSDTKMTRVRARYRRVFGWIRQTRCVPIFVVMACKDHNALGSCEALVTIEVDFEAIRLLVGEVAYASAQPLPAEGGGYASKLDPRISLRQCYVARRDGKSLGYIRPTRKKHIPIVGLERLVGGIELR